MVNMGDFELSEKNIQLCNQSLPSAAHESKPPTVDVVRKRQLLVGGKASSWTLHAGFSKSSTEISTPPVSTNSFIVLAMSSM